MTPQHPARAVISRSALIKNAQRVAARVAPARLAIVVKDDAYAHGLRPVVSTLSDAGFAHFGALDLETALTVRDIAADAFIFTWVFGETDDIEAALAARLDLGVSYPQILERVAAAAARLGTTARVHLKIDTGLHRAGVIADAWPTFVNRAATLQRDGSIEVVGVWTHIAEASDDADTAAIQRFERAIEQVRSAGLCPQWRHLAASAASFERTDARFDLVRVGAFVYGIAPGDGIGPEQLGLTPALTLSTTVSDVTTRAGSIIARIPLGQVHGLYSDAEHHVDVAIRGQRHPVIAVGRTTTDIDVGQANVTVGDDVYLFGNGAHGEPSLQVWADAMDSIGEEIVIRLARPAEHIYVD